MSCEAAPFTLLRTEHGNVIARDNRDNQEFVFAECYSTAIAALILAAVTLYTERKRMNKTPPLIAPARERWLFPLPQPDTVFSGESLLPPPVLSTRTLSLLSQDRHSPLHSGGFMAITADG